MKVKLITTATNVNHPGFLQLKRSLDHFGWDYDVIGGNYVRYGSKMVNAYNYAKQTDCSHLFIVDAYDVFMLGTMQDALSKIKDDNCILFNAEKGCWPFSDWADRYPETSSDWKYLNGGAAFVSVPLFIEMFESAPILDTDNDQVNLAELFLSKKFNFKLDNRSEVFQSIAFEAIEDFYYGENGELKNLKTGTKPVIIHGNGGTDMSLIYSLLK
jgi:hypothetical protein